MAVHLSIGRRYLSNLLSLAVLVITGCATFYPPPEPAPWLYDQLTKNGCPNIKASYLFDDWGRLIWGTNGLVPESERKKLRGQKVNVTIFEGELTVSETGELPESKRNDSRPQNVDINEGELTLSELLASQLDNHGWSFSIQLLKKRVFTLNQNPKIRGRDYEITESGNLPKRRIEQVIGCSDGQLIIHTTEFDIMSAVYNIARTYETVIKPSSDGNLDVTNRRKVAGRTRIGATAYGIPSASSIYGLSGYGPTETHDVPDQVGIDEFLIKSVVEAGQE